MPPLRLDISRKRNRKSRATLHLPRDSRPRSKRNFDPNSICPSDQDSDQNTEPEAHQNVDLDENAIPVTHSEDTHLHFEPSSGQSQSRGQSHTRRRQNEEDNYQMFREDCLAVLGTRSYKDVLALKARVSKDSLQCLVLGLCTEHSRCDRCGLGAGLCGPPAKVVPVRVISLQHTLQLEVPIFQCIRCSAAGVDGKKLFHVHPMMAGSLGGSAVQANDLLAGTVDRERTWFDLSMLEFLRLLRKNNPRVAISGFTETLYELQGQQGESLPPKDSVRKQLGKTLEEYENILFQADSQLSDKFQPNQSLLDSCAACAGMPKEQGGAGGELVSRFQGYCDGNFRLPHLTDAGTATTHASPLQKRFLQDEDVRDFCLAKQKDLPPVPANACNDFNADKELNRSAQKFDVTGVFGVFCRHGMLICALNMLTGERWSYATFILFTLLSSGIVPSFWWYDINCRYKGHFQRWLDTSSFPEHIKAAARGIQFPLPTWHHSMHNALCQATNSFRGMEGAGRGAGEPPEAAWAHFGPHGYLLQYASLPGRQAALERIARYWNEAKLQHLPLLLGKMYMRAGEAYLAAQSANEELLCLIEAQSMSRSEFQLAMEARPLQAPPPDLDQLSWQAQYVGLLLEQTALSQQASIRVSPDMLRFSVAGSARLSTVTRKLKVEGMIRRMEVEHALDSTWQPGEPSYEDGLAALRLQMLQSIEQEISTLVQHLMLVEETFARQATVRGDTKRLMGVKERQVVKIEAALKFWAHWRAVQPANRVSGEETQATYSLAEVCRGQYPWDAHDAHAGLLEVMIPKVRMQQNNMARAAEEVRLVEAEAAAAIQHFQTQVSSINGEISKTEAEVAELESQLGGDAGEGSSDPSHALNVPIQSAMQICEMEKQLDRCQGLLLDLSLRAKGLSSVQKEMEAVQQSIQSGEDVSEEENLAHAAQADEAFYFEQQLSLADSIEMEDSLI